MPSRDIDALHAIQTEGYDEGNPDVLYALFGHEADAGTETPGVTER